MNKKEFGNAILLAMSTLPKDKDNTELFVVSQTSFKWGDKVINDCRSQLEPVVKLMIDDIHENSTNKNLKIILLCTEETLYDLKKVKCGNNGKRKISNSILNKFNKKYRTLKGRGKADIVNKEANRYSAVGYFKKRIYKYVKENSKNISIEYTVLKMNEDSLVNGIHNTTKVVRELFRNCENLKFWVDIHGGFRDMSLISSAIISMLRLENPKYVPEKIMGVRYGKVNEIVNQQEVFDIFKFVGGMQDFAQNGNVEILDDFVKKDKVCEDDNVIDAMNMIANGIKECDPSKYEKGIIKFNNYKDDIKDRNDMLKIFAPYIESQFEYLIDTKGKIRVEQIVKRCVDKGLIQQALTIIESNMPKYMMDRRMIYYKESEEEIDKYKNMSDATRYKENINYVFDSYINTLEFFTQEAKNTKKYKKEKIKRKDKELYLYLQNADYPHDNSLSKKCTLYKKGEIEIIIDIYSVLENEKLGGRFLRMHKALKKCRNQFNHSSGERAEMSDIVALLKKYVKTAEELIEVLPEPAKV